MTRSSRTIPARRRRHSRRTFLRGLGGAAISLPFLSMGLPGTEAFGQEMAPGAFPKRFIFLIHPNGVVPDAWFPKAGASQTDFVLGEVHKPLKAFRDRLLLLRNIDLKAGNEGPGEPHQKGMGAILTGRPLNQGDFIGGDGSRAGWGSGISLDQHLAQTIGRHDEIGSLTVGVRADAHAGSEVRSRVSYVGSDQPVPPQNDPLEVFRTLFSDHMTEPDTIDTLRDRRVSVLDSIDDQFGSIYQRAGYEDRIRLDRHLSMIRDLERRLQNNSVAGASCTTPTQPEDVEPDSEETMPKIAQAHMDMIIMAMACNMTHVATVQFSNAKNHIRFPWLESLGDGHGLSHAGPSNTSAVTELVARDSWYASQLAYLLSGLDAIEEGDGTMLDNTVVMWTSEIARGNTHSQQDMPILLAGSAGGYFKTGRYVQFSETRSTSDLLVSIMHAMGQEQETTFGDARFCDGPLSDIT